jgi:hypothetical protein
VSDTEGGAALIRRQTIRCNCCYAVGSSDGQNLQ